MNPQGFMNRLVDEAQHMRDVLGISKESAAEAALDTAAAELSMRQYAAMIDALGGREAPILDAVIARLK